MLEVRTFESAVARPTMCSQVAADVDGKVLPPDDFDAQTKLVMGNLTRALAAGGAKLSDVTKITIYICNQHDVPKARGILETYFGAHPPGSTLCVLRGLANPNFLLEIEAIAACEFCSPDERPAFARSASYGGYESAEVRSAKAEATKQSRG